MLLEVTNLREITERHGYRVADRVMERTGIQVRRFLRKPDWVARWDLDALAAILTDTRLADAMDLASRLRSTIEGRLTFRDHHSGLTVGVTLGAAVAGTDMAESFLDEGLILSEARLALDRGRASRRVERAAILAGTVDMIEAARLLQCRPMTVRRLIRAGRLAVRRKGRHVHVERASLEKLKPGQVPG